jgi:hypothetical protein
MEVTKTETGYLIHFTHGTVVANFREVWNPDHQYELYKWIPVTGKYSSLAKDLPTSLLDAQFDYLLAYGTTPHQAVTNFIDCAVYQQTMKTMDEQTEQDIRFKSFAPSNAQVIAAIERFKIHEIPPLPPKPPKPRQQGIW